MDTLLLSEEIRFDELNHWLASLDLKKETMAHQIDIALSLGIKEGSIRLKEPFRTEEDEERVISVREGTVNEQYALLSIVERSHSRIKMILDLETMTIVAIEILATHPYFVTLQKPEHAIIWEEYQKGRY